MVSSRGRVRAVAFLGALFVALFITETNRAQAATPETAHRATVGRSVDRSVGESQEGADAWISAEAEYLSGRRLSVVCAATAQAWAEALTDVGFPPAEADEYYGFSLVLPGEMHLSPYVCEGLRLGIAASTRRSNELQVAWSVNVLVHESVHMARFTFDEALTEACARIGLPVELHRLYGIAYHSAAMRRLAFAATRFRRTQDPGYQGGTCSAPATAGRRERDELRSPAWIRSRLAEGSFSF